MNLRVTLEYHCGSVTQVSGLMGATEGIGSVAEPQVIVVYSDMDITYDNYIISGIS